MAKKNFYVIKGSTSHEIFTTWDETKANLNNPKYGTSIKMKGFTTREEAEASASGDEDKHGIYQPELKRENVLYAYVDGSYSKTTERASYGVAFVYNNNVLMTLSGVVTDPDYTDHHQVGGELQAAEYALSLAHSVKTPDNASIHEVVIAYDYAGIEGWIAQNWATNNPMATSYKRTMQAFLAQKQLLDPSFKLTFAKVSSSHSGNIYNDLVDQLAKDANTTFDMKN